MSDVALNNAQARREAVAAEINQHQQSLEALRRELTMVDEFIAHWHTFAELDEQSGNFTADEATDQTPPSTAKRRPSNPAKEVVGDMVEVILRERGRPASRRQIFDALVERGITLEGTDPQMVLSTMLWRLRERFERHKGWGYWLAGEEIPDAVPTAAYLLGDDE